MSTPIGSSSRDDRTLAGEGVPRRPADAPELARGDRVARYLLLDVLGRGSMGRVYSAYDPDLDRRVALKLVPCRTSDGDDRRERFLGEAKAMARIDHPNVVSVHDAGVHDEWIWVAMALVEGPTLDAWVAQRERSQREILDVLIAAGRGLEAAHRAGVVHRDFKPAKSTHRRRGV